MCINLANYQPRWKAETRIKDIRDKGTETVRYLEENNLKGIVLAGRPYHTDPEINHGIDTLITSLGLCVLTEDSISHLTEAKLARMHNNANIIAMSYKNDINEMSLSINGKLKMDEVTRADFELEAKTCGLGTKPAMKIFDEVQNGLLEALKESAGELEGKGFVQADDIANKIERRGVIHHDNRNK